MDPVGKILGNGLTDMYGRIVKKGSVITDENGNKGKVIELYDDRALVDFGREIGKDMIYIGERFTLGKW